SPHNVTTTVRRATVVVCVPASEQEGSQTVPAARRPSLLVTARLSARLRLPARNSNRSSISRTGEDQSAPHRQPGPGRLGLAAEAQMDAMAHLQPLRRALRCL